MLCQYHLSFYSKRMLGQWFYYLLVSCYVIQFAFYTIIYVHISRIWLKKRNIDSSNFKKYPFRIWMAAFIIGVMGIVAEIYPNEIYLQIFTLCYTVFFISLGIQYHNYSIIAPVETTKKKKQQHQREQTIKLRHLSRRRNATDKAMT